VQRHRPGALPGGAARLPAPAGCMTPEDLMAGRKVPLRLVIFDCDGVLIDSEGLSSQVVASAVSELGWEMTPAESEVRFLGMSLVDMVPVIEGRLGRPVPAGWQDALAAQMVARLADEAVAIEGAEAVLEATSALGLAWRVASNSSHEEMVVKFTATGLFDRVAGRLHSYRDVPRGKPAPDLFLAAAATGGVPPEACVVVEDSVPGITGARAAGMDVLGFAPGKTGSALAQAGAAVVGSLAELPALFRIGMQAGQ